MVDLKSKEKIDLQFKNKKIILKIHPTLTRCEPIGFHLSKNTPPTPIPNIYFNRLSKDKNNKGFNSDTLKGEM